MKKGIRWYKHLYLGPSLEGLERTIRYEIKYRKIPLGYYLLTLPSCDNNLFDILPAETVKMPWMRKTILDVVGVASSKQEAIDMAAKIIYNVYETTGNIDIKAYLGYK